MTSLVLQGVVKRFGGVTAVDGLDLRIENPGIYGLIGPNGAGKTTAFNLISGALPVTEGRITLSGRDITAFSASRRAAAGICRTFQTPKLFEDMTSIETVMTGRHIRSRVGVLGSMFGVQTKRREEASVRTDALRILERIGLVEYADTLARNLSYGHRRVLEIGRALAAEPGLLLLDEVTAGLNATETAAAADLIRSIAKDGVTIILVEHDMRFVSGLCDHVVVLNFGSKIAEGTPSEVLRNPQVITAYLGHVADEPAAA